MSSHSAFSTSNRIQQARAAKINRLLRQPDIADLYQQLGDMEYLNRTQPDRAAALLASFVSALVRRDMDPAEARELAGAAVTQAVQDRAESQKPLSANEQPISVKAR